ncbi:hypothetical protein V3851_12000 [Paenibacillus sp. M1]|uniref:DUF4179 domain-containing protein n=1 Tax=Paenibacillus haidiansis TaxID=1574488 RepID=A0ABU7VUF9_9BACL
MSNKNINQLFEVLTPKTEQKEKMFHNILVQSKDENKKYRGYTLAKRLRPAVLAAVLMVCLATTAFAATYMGLDEKFMKFLNPVNHEQAEYLSNGAYVVDKQVKNKNGTLKIKQVIGDSNLTYILMDFSAPKGTILDATRYRFLDYDITDNQDYRSVGFKVLDDGNRSDNKISLVMTIVTKSSIAGQDIHFQLKDLQAADPFPGIFTTVIPGVWGTDFKLDFKEYSTPYEVNKNISMFGYGAVLKTISVSPISVSLKIESSSMKEINEAAGSLKEIGPNQILDNYPITIKYQDGTSETTSLFNGIHLMENGTQLFTVKMFEKVINDKEIASIVFFDKEIPIKN